MARTQLNTILKKEASNYLGIPYWRNRLLDGKIIKEGFMGGKGSWSEIKKATQKLLPSNQITAHQIYKLQKKNRIGIDCSGLAYNLLDFISLQTNKISIDKKVLGSAGGHGIRRVSSSMLTSPINSIEIKQYENIKSGDMIRMDNGRHVMIIIDATNELISYVHSSNKTKTRGVHLGNIKIADPSKTLEFQKWSETTKNNQPYSTLFNSKKGDGVFRLKCLS